MWRKAVPAHLIEREFIGGGVQAGGGFQPPVDARPHYGPVGGAGAGPNVLAVEASQLHLYVMVDTACTHNTVSSSSDYMYLHQKLRECCSWLGQTAQVLPKHTARTANAGGKQRFYKLAFMSIDWCFDQTVM